MSSAQARLAAVSGALSASHPQGLLKDEVAIITGVSAQLKFVYTFDLFCIALT